MCAPLPTLASPSSTPSLMGSGVFSLSRVRASAALNGYTRTNRRPLELREKFTHSGIEPVKCLTECASPRWSDRPGRDMWRRNCIEDTPRRSGIPMKARGLAPVRFRRLTGSIVDRRKSNVRSGTITPQRAFVMCAVPPADLRMRLKPRIRQRSRTEDSGLSGYAR